jgi:hypothetical protein
MTLGAAIYAKLTATTAIKALVANRIFPVNAPDKPERPYIIYQVLGGRPASTHGEAAGDSRMRSVQFACFAEDHEAAREVRDAVITALDNQTLGNGDIGQLEDGDRDDFDQVAELYRSDADMLF